MLFWEVQLEFGSNFRVPLRHPETETPIVNESLAYIFLRVRLGFAGIVLVARFEEKTD